MFIRILIEKIWKFDSVLGNRKEQVIIKELIILNYPLLLAWLVVKPVYTTEYKNKNLSKRFLKIRIKSGLSTSRGLNRGLKIEG